MAIARFSANRLRMAVSVGYMRIALPNGEAIPFLSANACGWQLGLWLHEHCHAGQKKTVDLVSY